MNLVNIKIVITGAPDRILASDEVTRNFEFPIEERIAIGGSEAEALKPENIRILVEYL